jgi:hypothetical protein
MQGDFWKCARLMTTLPNSTNCAGAHRLGCRSAFCPCIGGPSCAAGKAPGITRRFVRPCCTASGILLQRKSISHCFISRESRHAINVWHRPESSRNSSGRSETSRSFLRSSVTSETIRLCRATGATKRRQRTSRCRAPLLFGNGPLEREEHAVGAALSIRALAAGLDGPRASDGRRTYQHP